ncbi:Hsp20/alpha crystallin family protein [Methylocapsa palsarum]|uniref:Molecular chaperone IbpA, HSP20 family n=1 Tax=Methylocapsa palsarum TaxID=1612308 RepID=A0A1I4B068_9HYPH|nr:Hsp20/alpha crystallin family protein [Methylocapsa palsarum]SFK62292.1 hypothetical protein SAMN05444581_11277 [Methylocapsa palsarum]
MNKDDPGDKNDEAGAAAFTRIAQGLSTLFDVLSDFDNLPRRGRHEKDVRVMENSFDKRAVGEVAGKREATENASLRRENSSRREAKRSSIEVLEPVADVVEKPDEILLLFELPGVERKDIRCLRDGAILLLEAQTGERLYRKEMLFENLLAGGAPKLSLRNGVLELRLSKRR